MVGGVLEVAGVGGWVPEGVGFCVCPEGVLRLSSGLGVLLPECLGCVYGGI